LTFLSNHGTLSIIHNNKISGAFINQIYIKQSQEKENKNQMEKENIIKKFNYNNTNEVRTIMIDNNPWFVAKDICNILEISNGRDAIIKLDEDEKQLLQGKDSLVGLTDDPNTTKLTVINESGLYNLVLSSRKPEAKEFKRWITHEILPQIHKTGGYIPINQNQEDNDEDIMAKAILIAQKTIANQKLELTKKQKQIEEKQQRIIEMEPKEEFYDDVVDATGLKSVSEVAKELKTGQKRLFEYLRYKKVLMSDNIPYQQYIDQKYFEVKQSKFNNGRIDIVTNTTKVTPKGVTWLHKFINEDINADLFLSRV
jgi:prophage antirepressor-like protein